MTKRGLVILLVAVLAVGGAAAAIASSIGGSNNTSAVHTMPGGQTMQGESMESGSTSGMPTTQHQMPNGKTMPGSGGSGMGGGPMDGSMGNMDMDD